ncbi:MAG: Recombination protein RecR [Holosporales bacterium]
MFSSEINNLIHLLGKLPGLGPRSGRRAALHLLKKKEVFLKPLLDALQEAYLKVDTCPTCGNLDACMPCSICQDTKRDDRILCVVENVSDLWAMERSKMILGRYHILGGVLSAIDGFGPDALNIPKLHERMQTHKIEEVVLSLSATVDGQTTLHYIAQELKIYPHVKITTLAHGVPVGGELDYLDDGTLSAAFMARRLVA